MEIRELVEADLPSLGELALAVYDEAPFATTFTKRPERQELTLLMEKKVFEIKNGRLVDVVAFEGGKVLADCEITKTGSADGLLGIIVARNHRKMGTGRKLIETGMEKAKGLGIRNFYANIDKKNEGAMGFFAKCGFKLYGSYENKIVMLRTL